jgi:integrase
VAARPHFRGEGPERVMCRVSFPLGLRCVRRHRCRNLSEPFLFGMDLQSRKTAILTPKSGKKPEKSSTTTFPWPVSWLPPLWGYQERTLRASSGEAKLCRAKGGELEQIQFLLGHESILTTERYLGSEQDLKNAVNDALVFE